MNVERQFRVASRCELLPYLMSLPIGLSRKQAKELLRFRAVTVGRESSPRHDTRLEPGDIVSIAVGKRASAAPAQPRGLKIVHHDDFIVVIDKPSGLLSMGSAREKERTAHRILNEHFKATTKSPMQQVFIVHRLDRETSGLMLFARSTAVQSTLQRNWKSVTKKYLAIIEGTPSRAEGTLKDRLVESKSFKVHRVEKGGELAITHYRVLASHGDRSLVELTLETGRKHQIRVQMASIGHPIAGDAKYDATTNPARRIALHACELRFTHPITGASIEFRSALPGNLKALL
jgi:23S rRNA pseudouridine1911/1915/1917 synthase